MKEAAGEANLTVITIVLIAIVLGVGTVVVTGIMNNTKRKSCCESAGGTLSGSSCIVDGVPQAYNDATSSYGACLKGN